MSPIADSIAQIEAAHKAQGTLCSPTNTAGCVVEYDRAGQVYVVYDDHFRTSYGTVSQAIADAPNWIS